MHHVRRWAHHAAHESKYNPWHATSTTARPPDRVLTNTQPQEPHPAATPPLVEGATPGTQHAVVAEPDKDKPQVPISRRIWANVRNSLFRSWVNILLVFVPAGIAAHFAKVNPNVVFALNAIAIIPLAGLLTYATESVAHRLGPTLGALLNVSFGNAVELIIFIIALVKGEIRIVQASLVGSILANLLLILGMAFLIGGLQYREQVYDSTITQMSACLLALSVLSLLIPTAFHASFNDLGLADAAVLKVSRGVSVILLIVYVLYLLFQLKSHSYLYQGVPQHIIDEQSRPGVLARFDSTSSSSTSAASSSSSIRSASSASGSHRKVRKRLRAKLGMKRHAKVEITNEPSNAVEQDEKGLGLDTLQSVSPSSSARPVSASETDVARYGSPQVEEQDQVSNLRSAVGFHPPTPRTERPRITTRYSTPIASSEGTNTASPPAAFKRPAANLRAFSSFRPPPVFRASTNPQEGLPLRSLPPHQLRRLRTEPNSSLALVNSVPEPDHTSEKSTGGKNDRDEAPMSQTASIVLLLCSTGLVALCAEFLVGSIEHLVESSPLSEAFIGLIILPIVGNAAEHVTAVTVAAKNKLDLALAVSLGSSIQIALFVTPVVVILGWILDKTMSLYFNLFEVASLFVSTFIVNFLVLDGRSNYLEGALLCACYIILAVAAYFFPDGQNQSTISAGSGGA